MQLGPEFQQLIFYSNTYGGQNKSCMVISMFTYVLQVKTTLRTIEHKSLVPGHAHLECDSDHSIVERKSKKSPFPIHHPRDWYQLVRMCGGVTPMDQEDFFDFRLLSAKKGVLQKKRNNENGDLFEYRKIKCLQLEQNFGKVNYKNSLNDLEPFLSINFKRISKHVQRQCYSKNSLNDLEPFLSINFKRISKHVNIPLDNVILRLYQ
ncbi:hypothetical protein QE152_g10008 [Popillia japonica]|uniref:Uncharacterized protein n=1 Tax=Popillia japonica TaxID=7064 RepID=A0AAW1LV11_POPJA